MEAHSLGKPNKKIPLANGLLISETDFIHGQLEASLINHGEVEIIIKRKPYGGRSDVRLSITKKGLQCMIDILVEAAEKLDQCWLSELALQEIKTTKKPKVRQE
jgi:hypothetical protein